MQNDINPSSFGQSSAFWEAKRVGVECVLSQPSVPVHQCEQLHRYMRPYHLSRASEMANTGGGRHSTNKVAQSTMGLALPNPGRRRYLNETDSPYFKTPDTPVEEHAPEARSDPEMEAEAAPPRLDQEDSLRSRLRKLSIDASKTPPAPNPRCSDNLAALAQETKSILPDILKAMPWAPPDGILFKKRHIDSLHPKYCPRFRGTKIEVINSDTIDAAIELTDRTKSMTTDKRPVCVLNMANAYRAGGGWLHGALAQEEAMCYRSSLSFTLKIRYYPLPECGGIYSPTVIVIRENLVRGHGLLDLTKPGELPIFSAVSFAAIEGPEVTRDDPPRYKHRRDREMMKSKMRCIIRLATIKGHRRLILGAFGCGAFLNPNQEVADCWAEVFEEPEFGGGWWESVIFAVLDSGEKRDGADNFGVFYRTLNEMGV